MGPIQKYRIYSKHWAINSSLDVFPWEFMVHLSIVIFTTLQILAMNETTGNYSRN